DHAQALQHAQRAGVEVENVLQIQRVAHEADAYQEAEHVADASRRQKNERERGDPDDRQGDAIGGERCVRAGSQQEVFLAQQREAKQQSDPGPGQRRITRAVHGDATSSAWPISHRISSSVSRPTESRIISGNTPAARCSASSSWRCVVEAGWITRVRASPTLARWERNCTASMKRTPASAPPLRPKVRMPPAPRGK